MQGVIDKFSISNAKADIPEIKAGQTVKVYQKIKEGDKERVQIFQGLVIAMHRKKGTSATITVRKDSFGVGVERIFPLSAPFIEKIEVVRQSKVRRAKLFYMRALKGKKARLKNTDIDNNGDDVVVETEQNQETVKPENNNQNIENVKNQ